MSKGWITLHRDIQDHWVFDDAERFKAWVTVLMVVNHGKKKSLFKGKVLECDRGESLLSHSSWADKFGKKWNRQKVIRFFKLLESESMIKQVNEQVTTRLIVNNYAQYQDIGKSKQTPNKTASDTPNEHQTNTRRTPDDTQLNNVNHVNNETSNGAKPKTKRFVKPSVDEIRDYCVERGNTINPEDFFNSNETKGWVVGRNKTPMKDWKAAVRTWESNQQKFSNPVKSTLEQQADRFLNG